MRGGAMYSYCIGSVCGLYEYALCLLMVWLSVANLHVQLLIP